MPIYRRRFFHAALLAATLLSSSAVGASAREDNDERDRDANHAVFVQTNDPAGNHVLAYHRASNGTLTLSATYDTGGTGGRVQGAAVDPLASQGSLIYDAEHALLIGVNAGSDTVYAFHVAGDRLAGRQVLSSGGTFPVSLAAHDDLLYVVNGLGMGSVHGYRIDDDGELHAISDSTRSLGLAPPAGATAFLNSPGQVGFTPDGRELIVTTKLNGSNIDVFRVRRDGRLSESPVKNASATPVPFAFVFDPQGHLVVAEAAKSSVSTYVTHADGTLTAIASLTDAQVALCWIDRVGGLYFAANAGSGTVSGFRIDASGRPSLIGNTAVGAGPIDLAHARGGSFLYVQLGGAGSVAALGVNRNGSLTPLGTVTTSPNQEGIVAI